MNRKHTALRVLLLTVLALLLTASLVACKQNTPVDTPQGGNGGDGGNTTPGTYTVTYHTEGGTLDETAPTSFTKESETLALPNPWRNGYTFTGWVDAERALWTEIPSGTENNIELWATWTPLQYSLRLTLDGGLTDAPSVYVYTVESQDITLPTPTRDGFTFGGWYTNPGYTGDAITVYDCSLGGNNFLYAKWNAISYMLTLSAGEGTVSQTTIPYNVGNGLITLPTPEAAGKYFVAWYRDAAFTGTPMWQFRSTTGESMTLYARYADTQAEADAVRASVIEPHEDPLSTDGQVLYFDMNTTGKIGTNASGVTTPILMADGHYVQKIDFSTVFDGPRLASSTGLQTSIDNTQYNAVSFWVYSEAATGGQFGIIFTPGDVGKAYCRIDVTVNWEGWKHFIVSYEDFGKKNTSMDKADAHPTWVWITNQGWTYSDTGLKEGTVVYIDSLYFVKTQARYPVSPDELTNADLKAAKDNLRVNLIGTEESRKTDTILMNSITQPSVINKWVSDMNLSSTDTLWSDIGKAGGNIYIIELYYKRIYEMARSYATGVYRDSELITHISNALKWMTTNVYNDTVSRPGNWYNWEISSAKYLVNTLLLLESELGSSVKNPSLRALNRFTPYPGYTYANRAMTGYVAVTAALLRNDKEQVVKCMELMMSCFDYTDARDGFYLDGSFIQHEHTPYISGYGGDYLSNMANLLYGVQGTALAWDQAYVERYFDFFFDSYDAMIYKGCMMLSATGRGGGTFDPLNGAKAWVANAFKVVHAASDETRAHFYSIVATHMELNPDFAKINSNLDPSARASYNDFLAKREAGEITVDPNYRAYLMTASDRVYTKTEKYAAALALSSQRVYRYEAINDANGDGWYMGDGVLYVVSGDDPNGYYGNYLRNIDRYRFPGITATTAERQSKIFTVDSNPYGSFWFVGGTADDAENPTYSMGFMHLGASGATDTYKSGVAEDLEAKKAWFFFDDEIVAIGCGITSTTANGVYTVVDNRLVDNYWLAVNGQLDSTTDEHTKTDTSYIFLVDSASVGADTTGFGYYFPGTSDVTIKKNGKYAEILLDHGVRPTNDTYAYVMLPGVTGRELSAYTKAPEVQILTNTTTVSAVTETTLGMTGIVFWEDGASYTVGEVAITANNACGIMLTDKGDGTYTFSLSEPTQLKSSITVTLDGVWQVSGNDAITAEVIDGRTVLTLNCAGALGATFTCTLSK